MARRDYLNDSQAPKANALVPAASAIVTDKRGRILLHRRADNDLWALPGGVMELGESITQAVIREVKEETGLEVQPVRIVGVYSDPSHVIAFDNGEVRQEFSICFACKVIGGSLRVSDESTDIEYFTMRQLEELAMHPATGRRIADYRSRRVAAFMR